MVVKLTNAERDTILAALRRWQSYPAAREADLIATDGGKHKPLDNSAIERLCNRLSENRQERDATYSTRQSNNGVRRSERLRTSKKKLSESEPQMSLDD